MAREAATSVRRWTNWLRLALRGILWQLKLTGRRSRLVFGGRSETKSVVTRRLAEFPGTLKKNSADGLLHVEVDVCSDASMTTILLDC